MNILMMASSSGTLSYHLTRLSLALKKKGHNNLMVLSGPKEQAKGLSTELANAGIEHFTSECVDRKRIYDIYCSKEYVKKISKTKDIDVIHAQGVTHNLNAYLAIKSLHSNEKPSIVTSIHSTPRNGLLRKPKRALMTAILNIGSDMVLPVSNYTRELLIKHGLNPRKAITVHNAIDLNEFDHATRGCLIDFEARKSDGPTVVCVGNLTPTKGQEYYLMAAMEVLKSHSATFYVVGSGPCRKYLEDLAHRLGIEKDIVFTGRVQWPELYLILSNVAEICVSSSFSENFPFYILECMAARKPIVAANVGGVSEAVIDGVNGYLVPPKDPSSLGKAIIRLINNPNKAKEMGKEGRIMVEQRFSMDVLIRRLNDIYELALKTK